MRRRWSVLVVVAVAAATSGMAAPASAEWIPDCELGPRPQQTVIQNNGNGLEIYPLNVPDDAVAAANWVADYVLCLEGGTVNRAVQCVMDGLPSDPLALVEVRLEPEPVIIIHHEELFTAEPNCEV